MQFIIGGRTIDLKSLGQPLDRAFISLYSAYWGHEALDLVDFEAAALQFFDSNPRQYKFHSAYFSNFTVIWNDFLAMRNFGEAERIWDMALGPALKWENSNQGMRVHKGTPYYFWGMTALLNEDLDKGYILMHRAVEEDLTNLGQPNPNSPATAFAILDYAKTDQAFHQWVIQQANFLNGQLNTYSTLYGRRFSLDDFKARFLSDLLHRQTVFLFAYTLARLMRISYLPPDALRSSFASQLEINILFDIVLVIETAIKEKSATRGDFCSNAEFLLSKTGHPLSSDQLGEINRAYISNFDSTLKAVVDGTFAFSGSLPLRALQVDVAVAYGLRNHGAHNVSSAPTILSRFPEIQQKVMNVLFATVDHLY